MEGGNFSSSGGRAPPLPPPIPPHHHHLGLLGPSPPHAAPSFARPFFSSFPTNADPTTRKMFEEMANHMPLRAAVLFQQGKISFDQIDTLLALLNGQPLKALKLLLKNRRQGATE